MKIAKKYWFKKFFYAFRGMFSSIKEEKSMIFHLITMLLVFAISIALKINVNQWIPIIFASGFVIAVELINTALENLIDMVSFEYNINAQKVKDISAAATLVAAIVAITIAGLVFIPRIMEIVNNGY